MIFALLLVSFGSATAFTATWAVIGSLFRKRNKPAEPFYYDNPRDMPAIVPDILLKRR